MATLEKEQSVLSMCSGSQTVDIRAPTIGLNNEYRENNQIFIHPMQLQQTTCSYAEMSFDRSYGLNTSDPTYGLDTNFSDFTSSFTSLSPMTSNQQTQNWHLEDSDLLIPLPENLLHDVDLEHIKKVNKDGLDGIVPVTNQTTHNPKGPPQDPPMTKLPKKIHPKDLKIQTKSTDIPPANPNVLRPRIITRLIKEAERKLGTHNLQQQSHLINPQSNREKSMNQLGHNKVQLRTPRKVISPTAPRMPVKKTAKATQTGSQGDNAVFHREKFNRIYGLLKKLDAKSSIFSTPPYEALKIAQQRQIWLQALNRIMADVNVSESTDIFGLYFRYPFQPVPNNPKVHRKRKKPSCTA